MRNFWVMVVSTLLASGCSCGTVVNVVPDGGGDAAVERDGGSDVGASDAGADDASTSDAGDAGPACETLGTQEIMDAIAEATCARSRDCATYYAPERPSACHRGLLDAYYRERLDALASGHVRFDVANACQCLAELTERRCNPGHDVPLVCQHVFLGTRDGDCATSAQCGSDGTCFRTEDVCPGSCFIIGQLGEPCTTFEGCATGLACIDGHCDLGRGPGEACDSWVDCRFELGCSDGVCNTPAGAGEPCDPDAMCAEGLVCDHPGGTCGAGVGVGDACSDVHRCALGLRCASAVCIALRGPGAACSSDAECPGDFTCDGVCVPLPVIGDACVDRCLTGVCTEGTCVPSADGAACDANRTFLPQCEGSCDVSRSVCAPRAAEGQGCTFVDCAPGLECSPGSVTCTTLCAT